MMYTNHNLESLKYISGEYAAMLMVGKFVITWSTIMVPHPSTFLFDLYLRFYFWLSVETINYIMEGVKKDT